MQDENLSGQDYWGQELKMCFGNVCNGVEGGMKETKKREGRVGLEMKEIMYSLRTPHESQSIPVHTGVHSARDGPKGPS